MINFNDYLIPIIILFIIFYGFFKKVNVYESFLSGCIEGFKVIIDISPTVITMIFAINIFLNSGIMNIFSAHLSKLSPEVLSMMLLRPISGNATLGILQNVYLKYGCDSFNGLLASLVQGSTETTVYVIALYYGSIGVKKIKNTLKIGLVVDFFGIVLATLFAYLFFN